MVVLDFFMIVLKVCFQGEVIFYVDVDFQGKFMDVCVVKGLLMFMFEFVVEVVEDWRFELFDVFSEVLI